MDNSALITPISCFIILLLIAAISAIILNRIKFPYTIGLVVVGLVIGILADHVPIMQPFKQLQLTTNLILYVIVPVLIFDAAVKIDSKLLIRNLKPVLMLAAPGLIIATFITGILTCFITPLDIGTAMLFGALISATDPVAVIALFEELGAPKRLTMLVDGESLFNDATAIVLFTIIFGIVSSGVLTATTLIQGAGSFVFVFVGGLIVGIIIGRLMVFAISFAKNNPMIELAFSTVVAFSSFLVANYFLEVSGVMAVVGAGIVINWYGFTRFTPEVKTYIKDFWGYAAFVANSFIFLLLGLTEKLFVNDVMHYTRLGMYILGAVVIVTLARAVVVYGLVPIVNKLPGAEKISGRYQTVIFWGGLRGAVPIALVLSLPQNFHYRHFLIELTLGIVFFTLLVQGTTVKKLMNFLGINKETNSESAARLHALSSAKKAALHKISELSKEKIFPENIISKLEKKYTNEENTANHNLAILRKEKKISKNFETKTFWMQAVAIEKRAYYDLFETNLISETVLRELMLEIETLDCCIRNNKIPPEENLIVLPKSISLKRFYDFFLKIPAFKKNQLIKLTQNLEFYVAVAKASYTVTESLKHLAKLNLTETEIVNPCIDFFDLRWHTAKQKLEHMLKIHTKDTDYISERILCRAAQNVENLTIEEIALNGGITEKIKINLKHEFEN